MIDNEWIGLRPSRDVIRVEKETLYFNNGLLKVRTQRVPLHVSLQRRLYFVSILVLQSSRWEGESWLLCYVLFVFRVSCDCYVALLHEAPGLSAVCDCGIS